MFIVYLSQTVLFNDNKLLNLNLIKMCFGIVKIIRRNNFLNFIVYKYFFFTFVCLFV